MSKPEVPKADAAVAAQTDEKTVASASALTDADEAEKHAMEPEESAADRDFSPSSKKSRDDSPPYSNQAKLALSNQNSRDKFWFELCRMKEEEYNDMSIPDFLRVKCGNPHEKSIFSKRLEWYRSLKSQGSAENQPPPSPPAATANKPGETDSNSEQAETKESGKSSPGANAGNNHNPSAPPASDNNYLATAQMQQYNQAYQQYHMHSHHHYMQNQQGSQQQGQYPGYPPSFPGMPPPWALHHAPPGERGPNASPPQGGQHHVAPGMPPGIPPGMMPYHYPSATQPPFSASQPSGGGSGGDSLSKTSAKEGNLPDSKQPERQNPKGISPEGRLVVSEIKEILGLSEEDSETGEIKAGQSTDAEKLRGTDDIPPMGCRDTDVLFGRGGAMRKHHGNVVFRGLVKKCQPAYIGAAEKNDKMLIARLIIQAVRKLGGRFLKKNDKTGVWEDVDEFRVRTKISQALREGAPQLREAAASSMQKHRQQPAIQIHGHPMHNPGVGGHQPSPYGTQQRLHYLPHGTVPGAGVPPMWHPYPHHPGMVGASPYPYQQSPPSHQMEPPGKAVAKDPESQEPGSETIKAETVDTYPPLTERPLGVMPNGSLNIEELKEVLGLEGSEGKQTKKPTGAEAEVYVPSEEDVLMEGKEAQTHPGNLYYNSSLSKCLPAYFSIQVCKDLIASLIVDAVRHKGGRFLNQTNDQGETWKSVEDAEAISWVLEDLRSGEKMFAKLQLQSIPSDKEVSEETETQPPPEAIAITNKDVLMGRGSSANHPGNVRFRTYCRVVQPAYVNAPFNKDKTLIAKLVVQTVELTGGRFIDTEEESGALTIVDKDKARQKTAQAVQTIQKLRYRKERKGTAPKDEPEEYLDNRPPGINKDGHLDIVQIKSLLATTASIREPPKDDGDGGEPEQEKVLGQKRKLDPKELDALLTLSSMERSSELVKEESSDVSESRESKPKKAKVEEKNPESSTPDDSPRRSRRVSTDADGRTRRSSARHSPPEKRPKTETGESPTSSTRSAGPQKIEAMEKKLAAHVKQLQKVGDSVGLSYNVLKTYIQEYAKGANPPLKNFRATRSWMEEVFDRQNITLENWD
mmetsp:Transcript_18605/g.43368  ORF Transcript_18605/g.43368 Transcript_18605/m.43368 type:complete len:1086 (+) Transcript_18605:82-3339(+)